MTDGKPKISGHGGMASRFAVWFWMLLIPLFRRTRVGGDWKTAVDEAHDAGAVVHVLEVRSLLDAVYLNWALRKYKLPLARTSNGFPVHWFRSMLFLILRPILRLLRLVKRSKATPGEFAATVEAGAPALLSLKRGRLLMFAGATIGTPYLETLVELQRRMERPIVLVPHLVRWTMGVERYRQNIFDLVFGHPNAPGPRRFMAFMRNVRYARLVAAEPVRLDEVMSEYDANTSDADIANKARWLLHQRFNQELKVSRGPIQKGAARNREEIMNGPDFDRRVVELGVEMGLDAETARKNVKGYLTEIAADMREGYIEGLSFMLTPVFNRVFSGIVVDRDLLDTIRSASRESPIVLVPSHRSHIDYLILSYVLYYYGIVPPHIAAGANLSFFPLGPILDIQG
jgi:glycerol-3-phosphate O-acyltransferase